MFWSMHCANTESLCSNCGCSSGSGAYQTTHCCSLTSTAIRFSPNAQSVAWADFAEAAGIPDVTFHALRHPTSQLIDSGVDIVTVSKRLGHSKPDITLRIYAHLFRKDDSKAAAAINASF